MQTTVCPTVRAKMSLHRPKCLHIPGGHVGHYMCWQAWVSHLGEITEMHEAVFHGCQI